MKILVTGGKGLVGTALSDLKTDHDIVCVGKLDYDLMKKSDCNKMILDILPDCMIHLAARVGGIKGNTDRPADYFYDNIMINTNVLHAAHECNIKKVISILSTCIFPDDVNFPIKEEAVHNGEPHESNFAYAYAKRMLEVQSRAYRKQYGCNFVTVVPNNIFGENDNFHATESHVIPAMIRKFHDAVMNKKDEVKMWGNGKAMREFTYSKDIAKQLLFIVENYSEASPINLGNSTEISIADLALAIQKVSSFKGTVKWDTAMPTGQLRKPSDKSKMAALGWSTEEFCDFDRAIKQTYGWYEKNYPHVRGVKK